MSATIQLDEWLAEWERLQEQDAEGSTVHELAEAWGISASLVRKRLGPLVRSGRVDVGRRRCARMDGQPCLTPVYRLNGGDDV